MDDKPKDDKAKQFSLSEIFSYDSESYKLFRTKVTELFEEQNLEFNEKNEKKFRYIIQRWVPLSDTIKLGGEPLKLQYIEPAIMRNWYAGDLSALQKPYPFEDTKTGGFILKEHYDPNSWEVDDPPKIDKDLNENLGAVDLIEKVVFKNHWQFNQDFIVIKAFGQPVGHFWYVYLDESITTNDERFLSLKGELKKYLQELLDTIFEPYYIHEISKNLLNEFETQKNAITKKTFFTAAILHFWQLAALSVYDGPKEEHYAIKNDEYPSNVWKKVNVFPTKEPTYIRGILKPEETKGAKKYFKIKLISGKCIELKEDNLSFRLYFLSTPDCTKIFTVYSVWKSIIVPLWDIANNARVRYYSLKAAVAAIMSRNMSHNIGSHVLARISSNKPDDDKLVESKWADDVQKLSQYLQQRQDFIAQIATEWPEWTYPAWLMKDLMRWFLSQKHLLNYIGGSEGLCAHFYEGQNPDESKSDESKGNSRKFPIRFHVFHSCRHLWDQRIWEKVGESTNACGENKNGWGVGKWKKEIENKCLEHDNCAMGKYAKKAEKCNGGMSKRILLHTTRYSSPCCCLDEDIQLAIPGGITGYHAFYTILENVIRNGAKHAFTKMKDDEKTCNDRSNMAFGPKDNGDRDKHFDVIIEFFDEAEKNGNETESRDDNLTPSYRFRIYDNVSFVTEKDIGELESHLYYPKLDNADGNRFNPLKQDDYDNLKNLWEKIDALRDKNTEKAEFTELESALNNDSEEKAKKLKDSFEDLKTKLNERGLNSKDIKKLHADFQAMYGHLIVRMNNYFRRDLITESGELRKGNWGLGEIKISAGYLQGKEIMHIGMGGDSVTYDDETHKDGGFIIRATVSPIGTLAYEFRIPKPKEVGILCEVKSE